MLAVEKLNWYVIRSSGLIGWALITASVIWGLALSSRLLTRRGAQAWLTDLHRFLATLAVAFTAVHVVSSTIDEFVPIGPLDVLVPGLSDWEPVGVAWGIVAMYLLIAIQLSSRSMRKMKRSTWHLIHMSSLPLFITSSVHGLTVGTDRTNRLVQMLWLAGTTLVVGLVLFRLLHTRAAEPGERDAADSPAEHGGVARSGTRRSPAYAEPDDGDGGDEGGASGDIDVVGDEVSDDACAEPASVGSAGSVRAARQSAPGRAASSKPLADATSGATSRATRARASSRSLRATDTIGAGGLVGDPSGAVARPRPGSPLPPPVIPAR